MSDDEEQKLDFYDMGLDDRVLKAIALLGWNEPTLIQEKAIPMALDGNDILARARTGSGTTALFAIPVICKILKYKQTHAFEQKSTQAIIVAPSKELCHQLKEHIDNMSFYCRREIKCIDVASAEVNEIKPLLLATIPDIVVGTPAKLLAHIQAGSLLNLKKTIKSFVIDEADLLFSFGFEEDMQKLIDKIIPKRGCQSYLISATLNPSVINLKNLVLHKPVIFKLDEPELPESDQYHSKCQEDEEFASQKLNCPRRCNKLKLLLEQSTISFTKQVFLITLVIISFYAFMFHNRTIESSHKDRGRENEIKINLEQVNRLNLNYPGLLSAKQLRLIKARIAVMKSEVSILMLLGKTRDNHCKLDPTFCVGQTIANVTQLQFGYIDASDPYLNSNELKNELAKALDNYRNPVIIDSLEQLPGTEVMNLFQFIDKDESHRRKGMLILIVYTGDRHVDVKEPAERLKEADIAEKVLIDRWSYFIPRDSLTSVLSRICGSIVKVY